MEKETKKVKTDLPKVKFKTLNEDYIKQTLEYIDFVEKNKCKTKGGKNGGNK